MYTSRTTTTTRKQHTSSPACRSKAHAAYKQCKKKKDEEETFFFSLLRSSKSGAISIRGIHDAIDDEERDEADESDDEQEDCEADEEEEDDAAPSPEKEEEEKSNPDLDAASTFFFTPVEGLAPANVHRMGDAFFQSEDMELPIWPSVSPNVSRLSAWKTLYFVCILYASSSVMKWYQMYSKDASFMDFPAPSLLHAIRFTFHAVISILIQHHWSITSSSPSISWSLYFQKGTHFLVLLYSYLSQ